MVMKWNGLFRTAASPADQASPHPQPRASGDGENGLTRPSGLDAENPEVRHQVALVLDCSGSMASSMGDLNEALADLVAHAKSDEFLAKSVELAIIRVAGEKAGLLQSFAPPLEIEIPSLKSGGDTPLYSGLMLAAKEIESRREIYRASGCDWKKAMVVILTDGRPTDVQHEVPAGRVVRECEGARNSRDRAAFFFFGTTGADLARLDKLSTRGVMPVDRDRLKGVLEWLKASMDAASRSLDDDYRYPDPNKFCRP